MLIVYIRTSQAQWRESLWLAEALPHENRAVSDLESSVRLPHSDEQDPFRALWFLIPSRLEEIWGAVDEKAGGLADAQHIHKKFSFKRS